VGHTGGSIDRSTAIARKKVGGIDVSAGAEIGANCRQSRIPKWRATVDEDGQYCDPIPL
jgi:hypothetical protein